MGAGWKSLQTLVPAGQAQGLRVSKIIWTGRTVSATNSFQIVDPNDGTVLAQGSSVDGASPVSDLQYDFEQNMPAWHDFKVGTLSSGTLLIYFRQ